MMKFQINTKYKIVPTARFKKQIRKIAKSGTFRKKDMIELIDVINKLANKEAIDEKYRDHKLTNYDAGDREFHFRPDLLVVYSYFEECLIFELAEIGSHSELFG